MCFGAAQQEQQGAISVLAAAALGVAILIAALALDLGHVYWVKRDLQKAADLASISALANVALAPAIAQQVARDNNFDPAQTGNTFTVTVGIYNWDTRTFAAGGGGRIA